MKKAEYIKLIVCPECKTRSDELPFAVIKKSIIQCYKCKTKLEE